MASNMSTTNNNTDEKFNAMIDEKAASEENFDPTVPNPYQKGTEEHKMYQKKLIKSLLIKGEIGDKRWLETISATDDITDEEFNAEMNKFEKDVEEQFKKLASEEDPDPTKPNPYQKGTEEYGRYQEKLIQSILNLGEKDDKRWEERKKIMKERGNLSRLMMDDKAIEEAKKLFKTPGYFTEHRKRLAEQVAKALAGDNTQN